MNKSFVCTALLMQLHCLAADAALFGRDLDGNAGNGYEAFYDDALHITWLANGNLSATNSFGVSGVAADGAMSWMQAEQWINGMNAFDAGAGWFGVNTWRLPGTAPVNGTSFDVSSFSTDQSTDEGYGHDSLANEMGNLYYATLGNRGYCENDGSSPSSCTEPVDGNGNPLWGLMNTDPFSNLESKVYWSGTPFDGSTAFVFRMVSGFQHTATQVNPNGLVLAVASGDVAAIPLPAAIGLYIISVLPVFALGGRFRS